MNPRAFDFNTVGIDLNNLYIEINNHGKTKFATVMCESF